MEAISVTPSMGPAWRSTYLFRKKALTNHTYTSPASKSREMVGRAVEVTVDSIVVKREAKARAIKIIQNFQPWHG
jgi:hypothetical protein